MFCSPLTADGVGFSFVTRFSVVPFKGGEGGSGWESLTMGVLVGIIGSSTSSNVALRGSGPFDV
jgi:hypothetical protein